MQVRFFFSRWSEAGFKFYSDLATSSEAVESGCMVMPGYVFSRTPILVSYFIDSLPTW